MRFIETRLSGAHLIELEPLEDGRGFFARTFCREEFEKHGLDPAIVQCNLSYNRKRGTLRGMHYQAAPHAETKVVACFKGAIYDVIIDLRPESATFREWFAVDLHALRPGSTESFRMLYIPKGFAHGFQTLADHTEVFYQMSAFYDSAAARGVRWNDPAFEIRWPEDERRIADRDQQFPDFKI